MNKKIERFEFPDECYCDETHSICVYEDFLIWESIIDGCRGRHRDILQLKIEGSKIFLKCLEGKAFWDEDCWINKEECEKDENGDLVQYNIKAGVPQMDVCLPKDRYGELFDYEDGKLKLDLNKKEDKETLKWIKELKKERDMVIEDVKNACERHEMKDYIVARAYIFKHKLSEEEAKKQIEKLIKKANKEEVKEMKLILKNGNIDRGPNYGAEYTMKNLRSLQDAMGLNKDK